MWFGLKKEALLCEKKWSFFFQIEPYASLANFHTSAETSNPYTSKVITCPMTFKKLKVQKSQLLAKLRVNKPYKGFYSNFRYQDSRKWRRATFGQSFLWWNWRHTARLHECDRNDHKKHWFNLLAKRTVGFFKIPQKPTPVEAPTPFIFRSQNIHKRFGLEKEALLCEKRWSF